MNNYFKNRFERHQIILKNFLRYNKKPLENVLEEMINTYCSGGKFIFMGNGGSAADAQHASAEFLGRFQKDRPPIAAIALTTDTSTLTAISNDYSYEDVFKRQLQALGSPKDLVFAISTSGNSKNILKAVKSSPCKTVSLTGGSGGELISLTNHSLNVSLGENSAEIQEIHIFILHSLIDLFEKSILLKAI